MTEWLEWISTGVELLVVIGGALWSFLTTLPTEMYIIGLFLAIVYIGFAELGYGITGWGTGLVLTIVLILFVVILFFFYL